MKKFLLYAFASLLVSNIQAQEEKKEGDTTRINLGENKEILIITKGSNTNIYIEDGDSLETKTEKEPKKHKASHDGAWAGMDLGVNMLMSSNFKSSFPAAKQWEADPAKSFYFNFNFVDRRFNIYKEYVGITTGLGLNFNQIAFKNNYLLNENADSLWAVIDTANNYSKNKLRATYLQIPLLLEFNTSKLESKSFRVSMGVIGGLRLGSSTKRKITEDGENFKKKDKGTYALNPFKLDGTIRMGYKNLGIFANYSILPLFDTKKTSEVYPLSFGISYNF